MNRVLPLALGLLLWSLTAIAFPGPPRPPVPSGPAAVPGVSSSSGNLVADLLSSLDAAEHTFNLAGYMAIESSVDLLEALGSKEQAEALRQRKANLGGGDEGAAKEDQAGISAILEDEQVLADIAAAAEALDAMEEAQKESLRKAHLKNFVAGLTLSKLALDFSNMALTTAQITQKIATGDSSVIHQIAAAGLEAAWFGEVLGPKLKSLGKAAGAFDTQSQSNSKTLKKVYKKQKMDPPDLKSAKPITEASDFE